MKKFISAVFLSLLLFLFSAPYFKAKAYWNVLGLKIPSNIAEIKEVISGGKGDDSEDLPEVIEIPILEKTSKELESKLNPVANIISKIKSLTGSAEVEEENEGDSSSSDEGANEGRIVYHSKEGGKEVTRRSTYKGMLAVIKITPDMINGFLDSRVEKRSYLGYTIESSDVALYDDGADVNISMADGKAVSARLGLTSDGRGIVINSFENAGSAKFSAIEMAVIKGLLKSAPQKVFEAFPDYKDKFEFITITPDYIDIWVR